MTDAQELKIVFTGPMGAGKTTAISAISDSPPVLTDVVNNDHAAFDKDATTVALDYGQILLDDGVVVRLYGTPGQDRFGFMRQILCRGAIGVVLLLDGSREDALASLESFMADVRSLNPMPALVVGIGRSPSSNSPIVTQCTALLEQMGFSLPVFRVDVRRREDVRLLVETLVCLLEAATSEDIV
jgi:signal recognition particle receptor subunit beta